jgi:hypothetical protein
MESFIYAFLIKRFSTEMCKGVTSTSAGGEWSASRPVRFTIGKKGSPYTTGKSSTSAGGEWSASRPVRFTFGERALHTQQVGAWVGPRVGLDACPEWNPGTRCYSY